MDELINMRRRAYQSQQRQGGGRSLPVPGSMGGAKNSRTIFGPPQQKPTLQKLPPMVRPNFNAQKPVQTAPTPRALPPGFRIPVSGRLPGIQSASPRGPAPQARPVLNRQGNGSAPIRQHPLPLNTVNRSQSKLDPYSLPVKVQPVPPQVRAAFDRTRRQAGLVRPQQAQPAGPKYDFYVDEYSDTGGTASAAAPSVQPRQTAPRTKPPAQRPQLLRSPQVRQQVQQPRQQVQQARQQNPNQFRQTMAKPVQAPPPAQTAERQQAWAAYQQGLAIYERLKSSPLVMLVHKMAMDPGSFPAPDILHKAVPLPPPTAAPQQRTDNIAQAEAASKDINGSRYLNNVMDQVVQGSGVGSLRSVYSELSNAVSDIAGRLTAMIKPQGQYVDTGSILQLAQHIHQVCEQGSGLKAYLGGMYLSDVVFGVLDRVKAFSGRVVNMLQSRERLGRMRTQRHSAKSDIHESLDQRIAEARQSGGRVRGASQYLMEERTKGSFLSGHRDTKLRMKREFSTDQNGRATRLDEQLLRMREIQRNDLASGRLSGENARRVNEELGRAEDYDLTRELAEANRKRESSGFWSILIKDASAVATGLISLNPFGGDLMRRAINGLIAGGSSIADKFSSARQNYRNRGGFGSDQNKTDQMKAQRRHNLAHIMYRQLYALSREDLISTPLPRGDMYGDPGQWTTFADRMVRYNTMMERLDATGKTDQIAGAASGNAMLTEIRKSFYQDES